ncbi:MAG: restriction endonuclease subunit S [Prolixibacteraceae bacterium]
MPENWKTYKLGDVADVQNGFAFKSGDFGENGIPVIKIKNIVSPNVILEGAGYYTGKIEAKLEKYILQRNDFLISMTGSTVNVMSSAVGKMGRYRLDNIALINQRVGKIYITDKIKADIDYICHFLNRYEINYNLALNATGSANQANISPEQIRNIDILLPPLAEQVSIASIFSAIDDKIELNLQTSKTLEEMAMTLYKHWFVDFGPFQNCEFIDSELGPIPNGWYVKQLKDVLKLKKENIKVSSITEELPYVPIDCLVSKSLLLGSFKPGIEAQSSLLKFKRGDILFGAMRAYFHKVTIAPFEGTTRSTAFVFCTVKDFYFSFGLCLLNQVETINFASSNSQGSTIPYAIWDKTMSDMKMVFPPEIIINKFNNLVFNYFKQIIEIFHENQTLSTLRDTLLPKLISGEVRLKEFAQT